MHVSSATENCKVKWYRAKSSRGILQCLEIDLLIPLHDSYSYSEADTSLRFCAGFLFAFFLRQKTVGTFYLESKKAIEVEI